MNLQQFNQLNTVEAKQTLQACVHIASWVEALVQQRPFESIETLLTVATQQAQTWQWREIMGALAQHPRIGEKKAVNLLSTKEQQFSEKEQGALGTDMTLQQALFQGNVDYEYKFGHIFLIRAAGRSGDEMLAELRRRLNNSIAAEQLEVHQQLAEIAILRLQQEIQ